MTFDEIDKDLETLANLNEMLAKSDKAKKTEQSIFSWRNIDEDAKKRFSDEYKAYKAHKQRTIILQYKKHKFKVDAFFYCEVINFMEKKGIEQTPENIHKYGVAYRLLQIEKKKKLRDQKRIERKEKKEQIKFEEIRAEQRELKRLSSQVGKNMAVLGWEVK